jgi:hypothetical protein
MGSVNIFFLVSTNHGDLIPTLCLFGSYIYIIYIHIYMYTCMYVCIGTDFWWDDDCLPRIL